MSKGCQNVKTKGRPQIALAGKGKYSSFYFKVDQSDQKNEAKTRNIFMINMVKELGITLVLEDTKLNIILFRRKGRSKKSFLMPFFSLKVAS